ncbi:TRPT1 [Symbiodinium natans]|uniref:TRPT1 protein n=1 Tax=Symbiodinium natans TaxID=878477 RepID=A0A812S176_9DINO|nr:TRPT1 [Symbiodinium natans]
MGDSGEDQEAIVLAPGQLSAFLQAQGSGWLPARLSGIVPKEGVSQYLEALLWCLETYSTGKCPDCQRRFPPHLKEFASASLMVEEMPGLPAECFKARHRDGPPLSPLCCALAVLPVADARRVVLPTCPALAPLLQEGGLLGEVAKLESCKECRQLTAAVVGGPVTGKKAAKQRKALEVHKRQHQDVDAVSLEALEAEVRRLCDGAAVPPDATQTELKTVGSATEVAPAPKKGASRQKKRKRG